MPCLFIAFMNRAAACVAGGGARGEACRGGAPRQAICCDRAFTVVGSDAQGRLATGSGCIEVWLHVTSWPSRCISCTLSLLDNWQWIGLDTSPEHVALCGHGGTVNSYQCTPVTLVTLSRCSRWRLWSGALLPVSGSVRRIASATSRARHPTTTASRMSRRRARCACQSRCLGLVLVLCIWCCTRSLTSSAPQHHASGTRDCVGMVAAAPVPKSVCSSYRSTSRAPHRKSWTAGQSVQLDSSKCCAY